jgi:hypothetical protein
VGEDHGRTGLRSRLNRRAAAFAGLVAVVVLVAVIGAVAVYRTTEETGGSPGPQVSGGQLPIMTVSEAIDAMNAGGLTSTDLIEVRGWLQPHRTPPMSCPTVTVEWTFGLGCGVQKLTISEPPDGQGPNFDAIILAGTTLPDPIATRIEQPVQAVLVGHVHDLRASLCSASARPACESRFVLDQVASVGGQAFGPSAGVVNGESDPKPRMSQARVSAALASVLRPDTQVLSMTAVSLFDAHTSFSPGLAPSGDGSQILWYVRVAGPPPVTPPMPGSHAGSGLVVLEDETGSYLGGAGWGWDPAKTGVTMPDGTVSLHTTNWLPQNICRGVGLDAVLRGSREDPRIAWLEYAQALASDLDTGRSGPAETIIWPAGFRARFTPKIEIVDAAGTVVLRDGDRVEGACVNDPDTNTKYLQPPFT